MENLLDFIQGEDIYRKFEISNLLLTEFKCPPNSSKSGIWWHENFFAYILSGETLLQTPHGDYLLRPGECIFARRGSAISLSKNLDEFCEILIFLPDHFIKDVIQKTKIPIATSNSHEMSDTIIPVEVNHAIEDYFKSLLSFFSKPHVPAHPILKHKVEELIIQLMANQGNLLLKKYFGDVCSRSKTSISTIMESNFNSNLSLENFAKLSCRSLSSFKRDFRKTYGTSPGVWLTEKRLKYSKYLLINSKLKIAEIAFESGFENRSHYTRAFKQMYGVPPSMIRKK